MSLIPVLNSLPETFGVLGMYLPTLMDYKMGHIADIAKTQDFHDGIQLPAFVGTGKILGEFIDIYRLFTQELEYNHTAAIENTETEKNCRRFVKLKKFLKKKLKYFKLLNTRIFEEC
ncbi:hypothetical protein POTOM_013688 [Populus tomentosa]|uniref:Uncharacterized protein n=1 Tax=Populus tomentosa TaxID=118781 RepID=A0A8X8A332_POPTO|nr:hypothetical protein POTOM_013688 [Populus tomentosa]